MLPLPPMIILFYRIIEGDLASLTHLSLPDFQLPDDRSIVPHFPLSRITMSPYPYQPPKKMRIDTEGEIDQTNVEM